MTRFSLLLALLLMFSAFSLVTARYQSRQLYIKSDRLSSLAQQLDTGWRRLQLERAELTKSTRIDKIARSELGLLGGLPSRSVYINANPNTTESNAGLHNNNQGTP